VWVRTAQVCRTTVLQLLAKNTVPVYKIFNNSLNIFIKLKICIFSELPRKDLLEYTKFKKINFFQNFWSNFSKFFGHFYMHDFWVLRNFGQIPKIQSLMVKMLKLKEIHTYFKTLIINKK